jgi:glycerol-3-phosphate acyltransferase PlsY
MPYLLTAVFAYFIGSIPTGYLVARFRGVDIRAHGSGNIGATNAFRVLGKGPGTFVLLVDAIKGTAAVLLLPHLVPAILGKTEIFPHLGILAGLMGILGHNYTCWLGFKGGKGIATSAGVIGALAPVAFLIIVSTWLVTFFASRYVSVASIAAAAVLPFAAGFTQNDPVLTGLATCLGVLAIVKHKANIRRLLAGTESRFGKKQQNAADDPKAKP